MTAVAYLSTWVGWRANKHFFIIVGIYVSAALLSSVYWKIAIDVHLYSDAILVFGSGVTVILFAVISIRVMIERPPHIYPALRDRLTAQRLPERLMVGLPVAVSLPIFFSLFTSMKGGISHIVPFYADNTLIAVDRALHAGMDAWQILHPLLGAGLVTLALNFLYNLWFIVMIVILFCVVFSAGNERLRSQYLVAFVLAWALLGNVAATLFSSVGPAFLTAFYSDDSFEPLVSYLRSTDPTYPVWSLDAQGMLLANAGLDGPRLGSGISAFPSMHVAVATLNAIYLWRFGSLIRWVGIVFLIAIQLAAVHLAWHYAIDGYASMLATPIIWALAGCISDMGQQQRGRAITPSW